MKLWSIFAGARSFCFLLCLLIPCAVFSQQTSNGLLKPEFLTEKSFAEIYTLTAELDDQTFMKLQMLVTNIGIGNRSAGCQVLVLQSGEKPFKKNRRFSSQNWGYKALPSPTLSIGPNRLGIGGNSTFYLTKIDQSTISIILDSAPVRHAMPDSAACKLAGGKFYDNEVLIYWTRLKATITMPGRPVQTLDGYGMLEHSRSVGYPRDFSRGWLAFHGIQANSHFVANLRLPPAAGAPAIGWTWQDGESAPNPMVNTQVKKNRIAAEGGTRDVEVASSPEKTISFVKKEELCRVSIIDELGPVLGGIVKLCMGDPVTSYYLAQVKVRPERPPVQGVLELMSFE
jgi:hypothetical protein